MGTGCPRTLLQIPTRRLSSGCSTRLCRGMLLCHVMPLFGDKTATTIGELVDALHVILAAGGGGAPPVRWFRGQGNAAWKLVPGLGRVAAGVERELALIKRFQQNAYALVDRPPDDPWRWLFLMQHHGAPTRLLDWSENPLVALYFAVSDPCHHDVDGAIWCLDPIGLNKAAYIQPTPRGELPFFGIDTELNWYLTEGLSKPHRPPVAALAPRYFARIVAQSGVFTVTHKQQQALEEAHDGVHVGKIAVPAKAKGQLTEDLAALGITRLTLFPELDAVADHAKLVLR